MSEPESTEQRPPWERTGSTARERVTEFLDRFTGYSLADEFMYGMESTGGAGYPLPVQDVQAVLDELKEREVRG